MGYHAMRWATSFHGQWLWTGLSHALLLVTYNNCGSIVRGWNILRACDHGNWWLFLLQNTPDFGFTKALYRILEASEIPTLQVHLKPNSRQNFFKFESTFASHLCSRFGEFSLFYIHLMLDRTENQGKML